MSVLIISCFIIAYLAIIFEHQIKVDKAVSAIIGGVVCWVFISLNSENHGIDHDTNTILSHHLSEIAQILLFLIGAMTIVELIDAHKGFDVFSSIIRTNSKSTLLILISFISFFLSAVLDNLTTTIVMISILRKIVTNPDSRKWYAGFIIIAANAGGAWSPIGDVTTTMLWIGAKLSTEDLIKHVFFPSVLCTLIPIAIAILFTEQFKGKLSTVETKTDDTLLSSSRLMLFVGVSALISVPIFKTITHLPPYLGMMFALAIVWMISEMVNPKLNAYNLEDKNKFTARYALSRIEIPGILFFFGILLAVAALDSTGLLQALAQNLDKIIGNVDYVAVVLGILSAIIDNVPLVAASMGMYDFMKDHEFWHFIAFSAGTGGSMLIIGSAAGVAAMGMEKIDFIWYLKRISWLAAIGFLGGCLWFLLI